MASFGYRVLEPTGNAVTDTAAWQAALAANQPIWLTNTGQRLRLTASTALNNRSLIIKGDDGVMIQQDANVIPIQVTCGLGPAYSVTAVEDVSHVYVGPGSAGTNAVAGTVTKLTLATPADAANITPERYYKLASDDVAPLGSAAENPRMGEIVRVRAVNTGTGEVWLHSTVWRPNLYTIGIRLSYMNGQDHRVSVSGVRMEGADAGVAGNWLNPMIWLQGCFGAKLRDIEITRAFSSGIVSLGNFADDFETRILRIHHDINNGQLGYGTFISAGMHGTYKGFASRARHAITTNWTSGATGGDERHGPAIGHRISMTAEYCEGAGIDLHSDAIDCLIDSSVSRRNFNGEGGLGCGYQLRGEGNVLSNSISEDNEFGVQVFENTDDGCDLCVVQGLVSRDRGDAVLVAGRSGSATRLRVDVLGGVFSPGSGPAVSVSRGIVNLADTIIRPRGQTGGGILEVTGNADIRGTARKDMSSAAGTWTDTVTSGSANSITATLNAL